MENEKDLLLKESEVYDVLEFAKNMQSYYSNVYSPDLVNERMKSVNMNPTNATDEQIQLALSNPKDNEDNLIHYSQAFELADMTYKRLIGYVGNLPSFDLTFYPVNAKPEDLKKSSYKKDYDAILNYLDKFNYKQEFKKVMRQLVRQEVFYSVYRDEGVAHVLQELPQDYCKITQRWDYGLLFDFNMIWFMMPSVDINSYPKVFKEMYSRLIKEQTLNYRPSNPIYNRNGVFALWEQTSPEDNFWVWKLSPDIATKVPYFAPMFPDLAQRNLMRSLQRSIYIQQAQKVMVGLLPMLKDNKSGNAVDNIAIKPETMGKFLGLLKQGLDSSIRIGGAPFESIEVLDFDAGDKSIYRDYTETTIATSGTNSRLLFGTDKPNTVESQMSADVDEFLTLHVYPQFENFLNFFANRVTKKFKFCFKFEGTEFSRNRTERFEKQMTLMEKGIVMPQKLAASLGMGIKEFEMQLAMGRAEDWVDKLTPIINASQMSGKDAQDVGRKKQKVKDLTDSGANTREYDTGE